MDWRQQGLITAVKDQGTCASCWNFAVAAAIESALLIKAFNSGGASPSDKDLSEQQLMDCVYPRDGCIGGLATTALDYVISGNRGIAYESEYLYTAKYS